MNPREFRRAGPYRWARAPGAKARVPVIVHAGPRLLDQMDDAVLKQASLIAALPGCVEAVHLLPNASRAQGFPIGCVAAFDASLGGVLLPAAVGFDPWSGTRVLASDFPARELASRLPALANALADRMLRRTATGPAITLTEAKTREMLVGGAPWAVEFGWGETDDLARLEDGGQLADADPGMLSSDALRRQREEFGTLGAGEHAIEILEVASVIDAPACRALGLVPGGVAVAIDSGSRGLGSQVVVDALRRMVEGADAYGLAPAERDLACARASSEPALRWAASLAAAGNAALANRQALTHVVRQIAARFLDGRALSTVFDASRDTCRHERLDLDGQTRELEVHRRGAVRLLGPGHPALPPALAPCGQPVLIRGGIGAWPVLAVAVDGCEQVALASGPASSGRLVGRHLAWQNPEVDTATRLKALGLVLRCQHPDGLLPELAEAFRGVDAVVDSARQDGLLRPVARLQPLACVHL